MHWLASRQLFQTDFNPTRLGSRTCAGGFFRFPQFNTVLCNAELHKRITHHKSAQLGQFGIFGRITGGIMKAADQRLFTSSDTCNHCRERFIGTRSQFGLVGCKEKLHHTVFNDHRCGISISGSGCSCRCLLDALLILDHTKNKCQHQNHSTKNHTKNYALGFIILRRHALHSIN